MPVITPRTVDVVIYQGDDLAKLRELYAATEIEEIKAPARIGDSEPDKARAAAEVYDAFVDEAAERAVTVTVQQVGRRRWREARDACKPREGNETDKLAGFDLDALGDMLVPESIVAPVMADVERTAFLDSLSEADWDRLVSAVIGINTTPVPDPKALPNLASELDRTRDESSKPPERLA
jgi:hypothetical protein